MRRLFFDTETSGLAPGQIGQLSVIIDEDGKEPVAKNYFFKMKYITPDAEKICGRGLDFYDEASGGKVFADYKDELLEMFSHGTLVAHNLTFDEQFMSAEFWRENITFRPEARFDTMVYFKDICKIPGKNGRVKNPKLEELVDYFNINKDAVSKYSEKLFGNTGGFHDARYDTTSMFVAFKIYQEHLNGQTSWGETFCN